jgi:hypothetical protein
VRSNRGQKLGMPESHDQADHAIRWFGVPPPFALLGLTIGSFVASVAFLAAGDWPVGFVLLGIAALLASAFLEAARRRFDPGLSRMTADAADAFELLRARSRAVAETQRERAERAVIESERRAVRLRLAEAVQSEDEVEADALRRRLVQLDRAEERLREALQERLSQTDERIRRIRLSAARTMVVSLAQRDSRRPAP